MKDFWIAIRVYFFITLVVGLFYPLIVMCIAQFAFPYQANGSLIISDNKIVGSERISQKFESERYFWPRPSAVDYNALPSGGSNLGPTNQALKEVFQNRKIKAGEGAPQALLFASGSGLDPDIDLESAIFQSARIANVRGLPLEKVRSMVMANLEKRQFGFLGEERVNVLRLNRVLDEDR